MARRSTGIAAIILLTILGLGCGNTFRPIATPIPEPAGDPSNLHHAIVVNDNPLARGSASNIDTTGDTNIGNVVAGVNPVHAGFVSNSRTYLANTGDNTVTRYLTLSPGSGTVTIPMPAGCVPSYVFSRNNGTAYVACPGNSTVAVMNVSLDSITTTVPLASAPTNLNETLGGTKVYAISNGGGTVSVIHTVDNAVTNTIAVGGAPTWSDLNQNGSLLFVANAAGYVSVIDTTTDALAAAPTFPFNTIAVGANPTFVAFDTNRQRLYVVNSGSGTVSVIDCVSTSPNFLTVIATIPVGSNPTSVAPLRNGTKAYVSNQGSNTVSVIDATSNTVMVTIPTGTSPIWLTAPSDSTRVIVGVQGSGGGTNFADPPSILSISTQSDTIIVTLKPPQQDPLCSPASQPNQYCNLQQPVFVTMAP